MVKHRSSRSENRLSIALSDGVYASTNFYCWLKTIESVRRVERQQHFPSTLLVGALFCSRRSSLTVQAYFASFFFLIIAFAASLGVARFLQRRPAPLLVDTHSLLAFLGAAAAFPMLGLQFWHPTSIAENELLIAVVLMGMRCAGAGIGAHAIGPVLGLLLFKIAHDFVKAVFPFASLCATAYVTQSVYAFVGFGLVLVAGLSAANCCAMPDNKACACALCLSCLSLSLAALGIGSHLDRRLLGVRCVDWFHYLMTAAALCLFGAVNEFTK